MVRALPCTSRLCTNGITTADEVPARIAPNISALIPGKPAIVMPTPIAITAVTANVLSVIFSVAESEGRNEAKSRSVPLSNKMTTSASVAKALPACPKLAGLT